MVARELYIGYEEKQWSGNEIREFFSNAYECFGKHHSQVSSHRIDFDKFFNRVKAETVYRIFLNENFCIIFDSVTDAKIYFFGYTKTKPAWAKD